jgi:hypothetical protein
MESVLLRVAPGAVTGLSRLVQLLELKSELHCNGYTPSAYVLQVRLSVLLVRVTAWNSRSMASAKTVKT